MAFWVVFWVVLWVVLWSLWVVALSGYSNLKVVHIPRHNFQILLFVLFSQIDIHQNTHHVTHLVRNVLHQLLGILYTAHFAIVLYAYIKDTALCIGKTTNPFLVFVVPRFFDFYVLRFGFHHIVIHCIS